jgi:leucyl-tRNA synthetase
MDDKYEPIKIESKWKDLWEKRGLYKTEDKSRKKKFYILVEFPYPSGAGLHIGHIRSWGAMDTYARKKRMEGFNVLYPMGWDAFGLPAENYAIKMGVHPSKVVPENIATFKRQCQSLGLSFDWSREIDTTDPSYYKWTQWIFVQLFKKGLAEKVETQVNWCPFCKTTLANEEVNTDGTHERCGNPTGKRIQKQWVVKISKYAERLIDDLKLVDYSPSIALQQVNWIGKKVGINIKYEIDGKKGKFVEVFTTRPDTNFGATFIVVAPEHEIAKTVAQTNKEVAEYVKKALNKSERERLMEVKSKTGVFTGLYAINNLNKKKMPVYVSDFVLAEFGTGAVVGVPGHDIRDFEFAQAMKLPIIRVVVGKDGDKSDITKEGQVQEDEGTMINSEFLNGLDIHEATNKIMDYIEEWGWGERANSYHLRDWVFSRQHYWGEPIPMVYCDKDGWQPVPETQLPVKLPEVEKYQPTETGESPLAHIDSFVNTTCPICGGKAKRETDTMPNWAGSNWYFIRYLDNKNDKELASMEKMKYWLPVDLYQGGFEHTTLHLLYSRFIYKFLYDLRIVPTSEPYAKRRSHGIVLAADGKKMSKSWGNVINPDSIVAKYGADTLRMYEMFMGPFDQMVSWSDESLEGVYRFLKRVWVLVNEDNGKTYKAKIASKEVKRRMAQLIKKVEEDLEEMKFNTAVAAMMEFVNWWTEHKEEMGKNEIETFLKVLAPMAPFMSEELYQRGKDNYKSIHVQEWPTYDPEDLKGGEIVVVIQVDGKVRGKIVTTTNDQVEVERLAKDEPNVGKYLEGHRYHIVFVPGRILNFILE